MPEDTREFYYRANQGVHRKAAIPIGAPALVWHIAVWRGAPSSPEVSLQEAPGSPEASSQGAPSSSEPSPQMDPLQEFVSLLGARLQTHSEAPGASVNFGGTTPRVDGFIQVLSAPNWTLEIDSSEAERRGNRGTIYFCWHGLDTCIQFEKHTEYILVTTSIDLSIIESIETNLSSKLKSVLMDFERLSKIVKSTKDEPHAYDLHKSQYDRIYGSLYQNIWRLFACQILGSKQEIERLGLLLFDLRGFVTCDPAPRKDRGHIFATPFQKQKHLRSSTHRDGYPDNDRNRGGKEWARNHVRLAWPIMRQGGADFGVEYTASTFLDGRAVFISSMGPRSFERNTTLGDGTGWGPRDHQPVIYYLHAYTDDGFQIGRLLDRINQVGTMRLAAMVDFDRLRIVGFRLLKVEEKLSQGRRQLDRAIKKAQRNKNKERVKLLDKSLISYSSSQRIFSNLSKRVPGGAEYRIQRSTYYISQFDTLCEHLRAKPIEGYQPYREYVLRRLGGSFRYIASLNSQFLAVQNDMTSLYQYYAAESLRTIAIDIDKQDDTISIVQKIGEGALFLALVPYYFGYLLFHTVGHSHKIPIPGEQGEGVEPEFYWWISIVISYAFYAARGFSEFSKEIKKHNSSDDVNYVAKNFTIRGSLPYAWQIIRKFPWMSAFYALVLAATFGSLYQASVAPEGVSVINHITAFLLKISDAIYRHRR